MIEQAPDFLETERLKLRHWQKDDLEPFARLNGDRKVMEWFPKMLDKDETAAFIEYIRDHFKTYQFGLWAVELKDNGEFIGFVGLWKPKFEADFTPCVEVGWRLLSEHWGRGYAPEAAIASINDGFNRAGLDEIMSFTSVHNKKSIRVMEKIGLKRQADFEHPQLPEGHFLRPHVRYSIYKDDWKRT